MAALHSSSYLSPRRMLIALKQIWLCFFKMNLETSQQILFACKSAVLFLKSETAVSQHLFISFLQWKRSADDP